MKMNIKEKRIYFALVIITLTEHVALVNGCTVNYTLPELGRVNRPRPIRITAEYLSLVGRVMYPRMTDMVQRYSTRIPSHTSDLSSNAADDLFPGQDALDAEGLSQIFLLLRMFYGILHNMEVIEQRLHHALYTSQNFKPRLRILKRMMLTPINLLQVALFRQEMDEIHDPLSTVTVDTVCNYRNVYTFVTNSINDLETMENYFMQMALLIA